MSTKEQVRTVRTTCPFANRCGLSVRVEDGMITEALPADFPNAVDRGACSVGLATPEMVYHQDRLRYPLKRVGKRGENKWQRTSWEEALDAIAVKLQEVIQLYGPASVAWGTEFRLEGLSDGGYSRLASLTKGTLIGWSGIGDSAGPCADLATFGKMMGYVQLRNVENPKVGIVWGSNPAVTQWPFMRKIMENKKNGCRLIVIDPRSTPTAARADEHIQIRPGTDGALALAMINVILGQGLQDERFINENTVGPLLVRKDNGLFLRESDLTSDGGQQRFMIFDKNTGQIQPYDAAGINPELTGQYSLSGVECKTAYQLLADMAQEYTPEYVSKITEIPADVIHDLAITYATKKPAFIDRGWGVQRSFYSDLECRAINTLAAITGNMNVKPPFSFVLNSRPFRTPAGKCNSLPVMLLNDAIAKQVPQAIKAVLFANHNYVNQLPDTNRIISDVLPCLDLIVVCDLFMTATAQHADYVLPVASFYESTDLRMSAFRDNAYLTLQQKAIEPLHECKSDFQIAAELAKRMGYADYFDQTEEQYIEQILASGHPTMEGITLERLKEGPVPARPLDRKTEFKTPTGRIEFYVERLKQFGQELPIYQEPVESDL